MGGFNTPLSTDSSSRQKVTGEILKLHHKSEGSKKQTKQQTKTKPFADHYIQTQNVIPVSQQLLEFFPKLTTYSYTK